MKARKFTKKMMDMILTPEMRVLPGQLAFFTVMSLIPVVALTRLITSAVGIPLTDIVFAGIPEDVIKVISSVTTTNQTFSLNLFIFLIFGFILASNGPHSMIITSNEIYKIECDSWLSRRTKALFMTLIIVVLLLFLLLVPVFGDQIFTFLKDSIKNKHAVIFIYNIYKLLKYPLTIIILYINIKMIYVIAPDKKIGAATTTPGALFTTLGWIVVSELYSVYTTYFINYSLFYGSISSILVLLIWVYLLAYIFSLGMIINATKAFSKE